MSDGLGIRAPANECTLPLAQEATGEGNNLPALGFSPSSYRILRPQTRGSLSALLQKETVLRLSGLSARTCGHHSLRDSAPPAPPWAWLRCGPR